MLFMTLFFESVCFPTIVALGIRGLGRHTKLGAGLIVAGVSGGACVPAMLAAVADYRKSTAFAMIVPTMLFVSSWTYAVAVNTVPAYVIPADKIGKSGIGELDEHRRRKSDVEADGGVGMGAREDSEEEKGVKSGEDIRNS